MMRTTLILLALAATALSSGCATITTGQNQSVSVETHNKGLAVAGSACKLQNDKGAWFVTTPGSVTVNRSFSDLAVSCTHDKLDPATAVVKSSTKAMAFGNIIFGGVVGAAVDIGTGSAYDYPTVISVDFGVLSPPNEMPKAEPIPARVETPPAKPEAAPHS